MPNDHPMFLIGERLYLRPLEKSDLGVLQTWANDPELRGLTGETMPSSQVGMEETFERARTDPDRVWFVVVHKETHQVIGEARLLRMFYAWRTTDLSIILGDKTAWGRGFGTEAINLLLDYAFGYLNFHRVSIGVVASNERALRFYEKVGFKREGLQRDGYYYNHAYQDFVMMSLLEHEYRDSHQQPRK
jgi:RimJ/RimL family protein N-acetyltransferase